MTHDVADSSYLLADKALHITDSAKSVRSYAAKLFADIAVRIVAFGVDMILILFAIVFVIERIPGLDATLRTATWVVLLFAYFTASWVSPLRATPMQFLLGMRVLDVSGSPLSLRNAAIRSTALLATWGVTIWLFGQIIVTEPLAKAFAAALLLYIPSVTARRQGLHDFLARSVVINKRSIRSADDERHMHEFLTDNDPFVRRHARPSVYMMVRDAVALAVPLYLMVMGVEISIQKNMYSRIAYALSETHEIKHAVHAWYEGTGRWPDNEADLGMPLRHNYPDGGYYELEDNGTIRIQFEIRPELKNGSILIVPEIDDGELLWQCRTVGDIANRYLPGTCRS